MAEKSDEAPKRFFTGTPSSRRPTSLADATRPSSFADLLDEPTQPLPTVAPATGRVALIYEQQIRRPWRLLAFTAVLVALTFGVVLGQAEAYRPPAPRPPQPAPVVQAPLPPVPLTAPLGAVTQRRLEIAGPANTLRVRTADLGESLFVITAFDQTAAFQLTENDTGSLLTLTPGAAGAIGAEVLLNTKVAWTLKLTGGATDLDVDTRAGGLAGLDLAAGVSRGVLQLSKPAGVVPLAVTGAVSELTVRTATGAPVRARLAKGAGLATVNGRSQRGVKVRATLRETGWPKAKDKYDLRATADVSTLLIERLPPGA